MWKTLTIISGVILLASAGLNFVFVRPSVTAERILARNAESYVARAREHQEKADKRLTEAEEDIAAAKARLSKNEREKADAAAKRDEAVKRVEAEIAVRETAQRELKELEVQVNDMGGVEQMVAEIRTLEARRAEYDRQLAEKQRAITAANNRKVQTDRLIADLRRISNWQKTGKMAASFSSRVTAVDPDWGFVTIGAGNTSGVVRQAKLDVFRGAALVGKVTVTHVSNGQSVAEVVPGSIAPGDSIQPGDTVRVASESRGVVTPLPASAPATRPAAKPASSQTRDEDSDDSEAAPVEPDPFTSPASESDSFTSEDSSSEDSSSESSSSEETDSTEE